MIEPNQTVLALAHVIAAHVINGSRLEDENERLSEELEEAQNENNKLRSELKAERCPVPADPIPPDDRILPPCLRWTKERPIGVIAWCVGDNKFLAGFDRDVPNTIKPTNGWISFAESTR